jgi:hypothetical protein
MFGCLHLKGEYGGQLLCAIRKDENDDMFLIAYAIVEAKTRASWEWFICIHKMSQNSEEIGKIKE